MTPKFNVGDKFYIPYYTLKTMCGVCEGTGKVLITSQTFPCPQCKNSGVSNKSSWDPKELTIESIVIYDDEGIRLSYLTENILSLSTGWFVFYKESEILTYDECLEKCRKYMEGENR